MQPTTASSDQTVNVRAVQSLWQALKGQLEQQRATIIDEIRHYPPPIPACDLQYNYLLEQRNDITRALQRLERLAGEVEPTQSAQQRLHDFMQASPFIDHQTAQALTAKALQVEMYERA